MSGSAVLVNKAGGGRTEVMAKVCLWLPRKLGVRITNQLYFKFLTLAPSTFTQDALYFPSGLPLYSCGGGGLQVCPNVSSRTGCKCS